MPASGRAAARLAALFLAMASSACAPTVPRSSERLARCVQLYDLWARYEFNVVFHHDGQRARAELALYDCGRGRNEPGIDELERLLRRDLIPIPPR